SPGQPAAAAPQPTTVYQPGAPGLPAYGQQPPYPGYPGQPYGQPTVQMPARGYPPQPYGQAPQYAYAQPQAPYAPGYSAAGSRGSWVLGLLMLLAGLLVAGSTFLPWIATPSISIPGVSSTATASITGWNTMTTGSTGGGGFNIVLSEEGTVFLTGFFSLLFGALLLLGAVIVFFRKRVGGWLALAFAVGAAACAAVDIVMVYWKMEGLSPHVGLWGFAGAAIAAMVISIVSLASG
ncbi:MAG: hypothetical protein KKE36_11985, partial [Actinobacteria bacterium]|nr:hypothetical protein [Actinomycetota bacterium]